MIEKYSSGLVAESFWFVEFKQFIKLRVEGRSWDEIKKLCLEDNLLGISKPYRAKRIFGYLKNRVEALDNGILDLFLSSDLTTQKIITLIGAAKVNRLFFEFLYEDYREKNILGIEVLTPSDINIFFKKKQEQSEDIAEWTDVTLKRLRSTYMNFLVDAGLLTVVDKQRKITPPILDVALENYLKDSGETNMVKALTGVS
ncbi:Putative inner membrane protein [Dethiosulfatibacter aminovorans DSM 17477]|uniref:Putative inner membrane protein n=1 Tax=Dethiosulfatibacter aminovorans DSM 17477 TaxID=1121476 RepID=A0A1M6LDE7_9FIRM|nr:DUF1819 family protein [Dethiosulfatibacter aminovorans]SHJ69230.1 Putative inner membrane protein [Dethiosulfatibacter aminovorans DSM 17477]